MSAPCSNIEVDAAPCLHVLMSASLESMQACVQHAVAEDSILLIDTAVFLLLDQSWIDELPPGISLFAAEADALARGISGFARPDQLVSDQGWVELVARYPHCLSWK